VVDIIAVVNEWPLLEQAHQVVNRLQAVGFGGFYQAVQHRTGIRSTVGIGKQPSFATNHERFDSALGAVVIDINASVG